MSDPNEPKKTEVSVDSKSLDTKKVKKGWSNPALRMMGIPKFSLPSRNWMIFWTVVAGIGGVAYYDKKEQQKIREKFMKQVEPLSQEVYDAKTLPRKLTIFIAPPPNDFLETSMVYFRKYIKPILNAAAIDFDVLVANKQGDIRTSVSERIRQLRKDELSKQHELKLLHDRERYDKSWSKFITVTIPTIIKSPFVKEEIIDEYKNYHDLYTAKDVLGFYYHHDAITPVREDASEPEKAGGVVCIGRGAYKEYIQGVHEGLLGPLDPPNKLEFKFGPNLETKLVTEPKDHPVEDSELNKSEPVTNDATLPLAEKEETKIEVPEKTEDNVQDKVKDKSEENADDDDNTTPTIKPYIYPKDYANSEFPSEFKAEGFTLDDKRIPIFFEQPIYVFMVPNILGFTNFPRKIYNWFNRRTVAQDFSEKTMHIVENKSRPFEPRDEYLAKEEELLWPKKWIEKGKAKNSEWVQEVVVDNRVTKHLRVYE